MFRLPELDSTDLEILRLLQENAETPIKQIAGRIFKSESRTHERIKSLRTKGYIKSSIILIDQKKLGHLLIAYTRVQLKDHSAEAINSFQEAVMAFDEVMECYRTTGMYDFHLKVVTTGANGYHDFVSTKLLVIPCLGHVVTSIVIAEHKNVTAFKLIS